MPTRTLTLTSTSPEMTREIGVLLGASVLPGDVVGLIGDLGAGKTVLVQGMARGVGATTEATSPTFVLMHIYQGRIRLVHADLYRLSNAQADELGLSDYLVDAASVIEWAERLEGLEIDLRVQLSPVLTAPEERSIEFSALSARGDVLLQAISRC
jgi:tRNA threonylcarbamoyladenosine biosynthesis protein TsaE